MHQSQYMFCISSLFLKVYGIPNNQQARKLIGVQFCLFFNTKKTVVKVKSHEIKRIVNIIVVGKLDEEVGWWVSGS